MGSLKGRWTALPNKSLWWVAALIFLLAILTFSRTFQNSFVWDARLVFVDEIRTSSFNSSLRFFYEPFILGPDREMADTMGMAITAPYYRPFTGMLHYVERQLFGTRPLGYNIINVTGHGLVGILALLVLFELTKNLTISSLSTLLFLINPTKTEVVCWAYSDSHIIGTLFILSSFLFYLRDKYAFSLIFYFIALLTIESSIIYPMFLLIHFICCGKWQHTQKQRYFYITICMSITYLIVRAQFIGYPAVLHDNLSKNICSSITALSLYLRIAIWPDAPVTVYDYVDYTDSLLSPFVVFSALGLLIGILFLLRKWNRQLLFFIGAFLIWISIFTIHGDNEYFIAEKGLYLPSLFLAGFLVSFLSLLMKRTILASLIIAISILHAGESYSRSYYWKNTEVYLKKVNDFDNDFFLAQFGLGNEYLLQNRTYEAENHFKILLQQFPTQKPFKAGLSESYFAKALQLIDRQEYDLALWYFEKAAEITPTWAKIHNNIGNIFLLTKQWDKSIAAYLTAIKYDKNSPLLYYNLALAYEAVGDKSKATYYQNEYRLHSE